MLLFAGVICKSGRPVVLPDCAQRAVPEAAHPGSPARCWPGARAPGLHRCARHRHTSGRPHRWPPCSSLLPCPCLIPLHHVRAPCPLYIARNRLRPVQRLGLSEERSQDRAVPVTSSPCHPSRACTATQRAPQVGLSHPHHNLSLLQEAPQCSGSHAFRLHRVSVLRSLL